MLTLDDRIQATGTNLSATVDGETVVLDIARGVYLNLNATGSTILQHAKQETTLRAICATMPSTFDATPEQVEQDVLVFADRLIEVGLLRIVA